MGIVGIKIVVFEDLNEQFLSICLHFHILPFHMPA